MNDGYVVRFVRKDSQPDEEYFYRTYEEACWHLGLFQNDDSGLYSRIEILKTDDETVLSSLCWE